MLVKSAVKRLMHGKTCIYIKLKIILTKSYEYNVINNTQFILQSIKNVSINIVLENVVASIKSSTNHTKVRNNKIYRSIHLI